MEHSDREKNAHLRTLQLMQESNLTITQINGQRRLGPPAGWTGPPPCLNCEVFVGSVPATVIEADLYPVFRSIGELYEMRLMMDFSGLTRGYCFVMYTNPEDAARAARQLHHYEIVPGKKIAVVPSVNNCRLFVGYIPPNIKSRTFIEKTFEITRSLDKVSVFRKPMGKTIFALLHFTTHRDAAVARRKLLVDFQAAFLRKYMVIEWAYPNLSPSNVLEECGVCGEDGTIKITTTFIPPQECKAIKKRTPEDGSRNGEGLAPVNMVGQDRKQCNSPKTSNRILVPYTIRNSTSSTLPLPLAFKVYHSESLARSRRAFLELTNGQTVANSMTTTTVTNGSNGHSRIIDSRKALSNDQSARNDISNIARNNCQRIGKKQRTPLGPICKPKSTTTSNACYNDYSSNSFVDRHMRSPVIHPTLWNSLENHCQDPLQPLDLNNKYDCGAFSPEKIHPNDPSIFQHGNSLGVFRNAYPMVWEHSSYYDMNGAFLSNHPKTPSINGNGGQSMTPSGEGYNRVANNYPNHYELQISGSREYVQQTQSQELSSTCAGVAESFSVTGPLCQSICYNCTRIHDAWTERNNNYHQQEADECKRNRILYSSFEVNGSPNDFCLPPFNQVSYGNGCMQSGVPMTSNRNDYQFSLPNPVVKDSVSHPRVSIKQNDFAPSFRGQAPPSHDNQHYEGSNQSINRSCRIIDKLRI